MKKRKTKTTLKAKKRMRSEASANLKAAKSRIRAVSTGEANKFKIEGLKPKAAETGIGEPPVVRPGSKLEIIVGLLTRPEGCLTTDVLKETGWPSVSMP